MKPRSYMVGFWLVACLGCLTAAWGQTATGITGLYNTGQKSTGTLVSGGSQVQSGASAPTATSGWYVDYASKNGGHSASTTYEGDAYAISSSDIPSSYTKATTSAEWITAPGADTSSGGSGTNTGGDYLPGNGIGNGTSSNEGLYAYTLAIDITGSGAVGTEVTTPLVIDMTIAADDGYTVYVNPEGKNVDPTGAPSTYTAAASSTEIQGEWTNTTNLTLDNGTTGSNGNAVFYIGTNYITVLVDNTNSINSTSSSTALDPSGLLVYQTAAFDNGVEVMDNGSVAPEVTPWLPVLGAVALYGFFWVRRRFFAAAKTVPAT